MTDPRVTLAHGTLTNVFTTDVSEFSAYPRTTKTHPDETRLVKVQGLYQPQSQAPIAEGEIIIFFTEEFGVQLAKMFVAVSISGTLEWKEVNQSSGTTIDPYA